MKSILHLKRLLLLFVLATFIGTSANAQYCNPTFANGCAADAINNFSTTGGVSNITNNNTGCNTGVFYSTMTVSGLIGATINVSVQSNTTTWAEGHRIWVDWNQNFTFEASESVWNSGATTTGAIFTGSFVIPSTALFGATRMRVMGNFNVIPGTDACAPTATYGEYEDYVFEVLGSPSSGIQPPIANFYAPDTVWINSPAVLINTSSNQSRVFWDLPNENPLYPGYFRQAGYIDTAKYTNNLTYTFTSPGLKLVKLLAVNNFKRDSLRDSIIKFIYVDTPSQAPRADFITFKRILGITEESNFIDLSTNGPTQWEWTIDPPCISCIVDPANGIANYFVKGTGQPGADIANPRLAAFDAGIFKVCLRVFNLRGTDSICKSDYVKVLQGNYMCSGSGSSVTSLNEGFVYGISGPYQTYARTSWPANCPGFTISPCADSVILYVDRIKMWPTDSIEIFNGTSASAPRLAAIGAGPTGQAPLTAAQATIRGGSNVFFRYKAGTAALPANYDSASFSIRWQAKAASYPKPTAAFEVPDTIYSNQLVSYNSKSTGTLMKYSWDTEGNNIFDSITANPRRTFLITSPFLRKICLAVYNCVGSDTICKQVAFLPVNRPPVARFTADKVIGFNTDTFRMKDQTTNGVLSWRWTFIPSAVQYLNGTTSTSQNPEVRLTSPVNYTVRLTSTNAFGVDSITKTAFIQVNAYQTPGAGATFSTVADNTMGISRVRFAGIDSSFTQPTSPTFQFINTKTQVGNILRGGKYAIVLDRPRSGEALDYKVWIDFNLNANFETNELVLNKINNGNAQITDTVLIGANQIYGNTRMRVGLDLANSTQFNSVYSVVGMFKDFNISIVPDLVKPVITLNGPSILRTEINKPFIDPSVRASDNIEGNISSRVQTVSTVNLANIGVYTVKYYVLDYSGNVSDTLIRTVIVELNSTGPTITLKGGSTISIDPKQPFVDQGAIALDNLGNDISQNIITTTNLNENVIGTYTKRYSITDAFNFTKYVERTIIVKDTTRPVITPKQNPYLHQVGTLFQPLQAIEVSDNYNLKNELNATFVGQVNENLLGTYFVVYDLKDQSNNSANQVRLQVNVTDKINPTITVGTNPLFVEVNEAFAENDIIVGDNYWPVSTLFRSQVSNVRIDSLGTYEIVYTVTDGSGNSATITRTVIVRDTKAPTIKLIGSSTVNLERFKVYQDAGVLLFDNYYSDAKMRPYLTITSNLPVNNNGEYFADIEGLYVVQYKVRDLSNNISEIITRTVNVVSSTSSIADAVNANNVLSIYPNPNNGMVKLKLMETANADVTVKVYNIMGVLAKTLTLNHKDLTEKQLDLTSFASGVYLVQVETEGKVSTHKINIVK